MQATLIGSRNGRDAGKAAWSRPSHIDRIATQAQARFVLIVGSCVMLGLVWAGTTEIDRVTRGSGRIVPLHQKQEVQHLEGGIVSEILVKEGDRVTAGQPLMRIENTFFQTELTQARIELAAKRLKLARLEAQASGVDKMDISQIAGAEPQAVGNELALFNRLKSNLAEQMSVLDQQAKQKEIELSSLRSRQPLVTRERQISDERLASMRKLSAAGAASTNETLEAERALQQALTRLSDLAHDIPRTESALAEIAQRKQQLTTNYQADAERDRTTTSTEIDKLRQNVSALEDRIKRSDVFAPVAGIINKLNVTTIGGVVKSGEPLAEIVPIDTSIGVEMHLPPADRANAWPGERAMVKVSAYEYSVYGALPARVIDISADALQDEHNAPYFRVRLEADATDFGAKNPVLPGMMAEVDVIGERQSVLASLLKPLRRIRDNALRQ